MRDSNPDPVIKNGLGKLSSPQHNYRTVFLGATDINSTSETDDVASVDGFKVALIAFDPWIAGLNVQVAVTDGADPVVATDLQPGIVLPLLRKVTQPGVSAVAVIDFEMPL